MLNKSGKSGHPCLIPDLRGNAFSFSPLRMMFAVGLSYMAFIMFRFPLGFSGGSDGKESTCNVGDLGLIPGLGGSSGGGHGNPL